MAIPNPDQDDDSIVRYIEAFGRWARNNQESRSVVAPGSDAERDNELSGSGGIVPVGVVEAQINSATDHLLAWYDKCVNEQNGEPPEIRLSAFADYTMLRPAIEAIANTIWILGPSDSRLRIERSLRLMNIELQHGMKLVADLNAAGTPDLGLAQTFGRAEPVLRAAAVAAGLDPARVLSSRPIDQSKILRTIGSELGWPTYEPLLHWARASAHSHSQVLTFLSLADRTSRVDGSGPHIYAEVSTRSLNETAELLFRLINAVVPLLNERGYTRVRSS